MSDKPKFPRAQALAVAEQLVRIFQPACTRIEIAGSLRRGRPAVGDVELVYVPRVGAHPAGPGELFPDTRTLRDESEALIAELERTGVLTRRPNAKGYDTFGPKNKLMRHAASGIPVDLFATTEECWFNYLVCRTGGADSNIAICQAAQAKGWSWTPYGSGFMRGSETCVMRSEREVFEFVGLPYLVPEARP